MGGLKLDALLHTATVSVDEKGAQATAAATAVVTAKGDVTTAEFLAVRPFVFFILGDGGQPLFAGRVASPAAVSAGTTNAVIPPVTAPAAPAAPQPGTPPN